MIQMFYKKSLGLIVQGARWVSNRSKALYILLNPFRKRDPGKTVSTGIKSKKIKDPRAESKIQVWFYDRRHNVLLWLAFVLLFVFLSTFAFLLTRAISSLYLDNTWPFVHSTILDLPTQSSGSIANPTDSGSMGTISPTPPERAPESPASSGAALWTFILALAASPIAWFIWMIRDTNRARDLRNAEENIKNDKYKNLRETFYKLQEWATSGNEGLQVTALLQLREYLYIEPGDVIASPPIPQELKEFRKTFQGHARDFFSILLKHRSTYDRNYRLWLEANQEHKAQKAPLPFTPAPIAHEEFSLLNAFRGVELKNLKKSASFQTMVQIVRESGYLIQNLEGAELQYADLVKARLEGANLAYAHLQGADLSDAHLEGAGLYYTHLEGANLNSAHLEGARLFSAYLQGANLNSALLEGSWFINSIPDPDQMEDTEWNDCFMQNDDPAFKSKTGKRSAVYLETRRKLIRESEWLCGSILRQYLQWESEDPYDFKPEFIELYQLAKETNPGWIPEEVHELHNRWVIENDQ